MPSLEYEIAWGALRGARVAGIDEVGRGPLAGPVIACALILPPTCWSAPWVSELRDSKALSARRRQALADQLETAADFAFGEASVAEIDSLNILRASDLAMQRALAGLAESDAVLVDGKRMPPLGLPGEALVKGDARVASIAAASILAKVRRDALMADLARLYPAYGWAQNAGYPTPAHRAALQRNGMTPHHRRSFRGSLCSSSERVAASAPRKSR